MKCFLCILDNDNTLHSSNQQEYVHAQSSFGRENFNLLNKMIKIGMKKNVPMLFYNYDSCLLNYEAPE